MPRREMRYPSGTMAAFLTIVLITALGFISTNLDNLMLLLGFLGRAEARRRAIVAGYIAAMSFIILFGWMVTELADFLPDIAWGWLGLVPISFGVLELMRLKCWGPTKGDCPELSNRDEPSDQEKDSKPQVIGSVTIFLIMLANGSDTMGVFLALYLESKDQLGLEIALAGLACALLWIAFALWLTKHETFSRRLLPIAAWILPFLLIGIGFYILLDTVTD